MDKVEALETVRVSNPKRLIQTGRVYAVGPEGHLSTRQADRLVKAGHATPCGESGDNADSADNNTVHATDEGYTVKKGSGGWWKVIGPGGEPVEGESEQSEEAAQANADALNRNA
jgi:hypothetical protein